MQFDLHIIIAKLQHTEMNSSKFSLQKKPKRLFQSNSHDKNKAVDLIFYYFCTPRGATFYWTIQVCRAFTQAS